MGVPLLKAFLWKPPRGSHAWEVRRLIMQSTFFRACLQFRERELRKLRGGRAFEVMV